MIIKTNQELIQAVNQAIKDSGVKKIWIAEKMGMSRQGLNKLLEKQSFSLDDANRILNTLGKSVSAQFENE